MDNKQLKMFGDAPSISPSSTEKDTPTPINKPWIKARFPHRKRKPNLGFKGARSWEQWQKLTDDTEVSDTVTGERINVYQHPYDPNYYIICNSWEKDKAIVKIVLKSKTTPCI